MNRGRNQSSTPLLAALFSVVFASSMSAALLVASPVGAQSVDSPPSYSLFQAEPEDGFVEEGEEIVEGEEPIDQQGEIVEGEEPIDQEGEIAEGEEVPLDEQPVDQEPLDEEMDEEPLEEEPVEEEPLEEEGLEAEEPGGDEDAPDTRQPAGRVTRQPAGSRASPQAVRSSTRPSSSRRLTPSSRRTAPRTTRARSTSPARTAARTRSSAKTPADRVATDGDKAGAPERAEDQGFFGRTLQFISDHSIWAISILSVGFLGSLLYFLISRRRRHDDEEDDVVDLVPLSRYEDEDEGPRRVLVDPKTGKPVGRVANRKDTDYALVVDEEELHGAEREAEEQIIERLIDEEEYGAAFEHYEAHVRNAVAGTSFNAAVERALGDCLLESNEYEKAARVLEHHVETQPEDEIEATTYFNLAYAHFKRNKVRKCRDYFRMFAEKEGDAKLTKRARKVLKRLERVQSLN